jgi:hypothetical protein
MIQGPSLDVKRLSHPQGCTVFKFSSNLQENQNVAELGIRLFFPCDFRVIVQDMTSMCEEEEERSMYIKSMFGRSTACCIL